MNAGCPTAEWGLSRCAFEEDCSFGYCSGKELIEAGVHFGHRASRWNPKMRPYIYARRNLIHIIDVRETIRGLLRARKYLQKVAAGGSLVLLVGTKRQASRHDRAAGPALRHALRQRPLAGRHADQLPHDPQPAHAAGRAGGAAQSSDEMATYSKKMQSALNREYRKMYRNLNGIRTMNRLPECLVVVDPRKEKNAIREARKLGITTVALIDTDCDPDEVDLPIPGNDDSIRSIELIVTLLADAMLAGKAAAGALKQEQAEGLLDRERGPKWPSRRSNPSTVVR